MDTARSGPREGGAMVSDDQMLYTEIMEHHMGCDMVLMN
jgi:hypothetical protein